MFAALVTTPMLLGGCSIDKAKTDDVGSAIPKGAGAFVYEYWRVWSAELAAYDGSVRGDDTTQERSLRYLFSGAGVLRAEGTDFSGQTLSFSTELGNAYAGDLPDVAQIPIVGGRIGEVLESYTEEQQASLALEITKTVSMDQVPVGVLVDIEPFSMGQLGFYRMLRSELHARGVALWLFLGDEELDAYVNADVVVLSGYDIGGAPMSPETYERRLASYVERITEMLSQYEPRVMVAVPAAASSEEYETESGACSGSTGYLQSDWLRHALLALCGVRTAPGFLGFAIWGFYADALEANGGSGCFRNPGRISDDNWALLSGFDALCSEAATAQSLRETRSAFPGSGTSGTSR